MAPCTNCNADVWFLGSCPKCHKKLCSSCLNYALANEAREVTACCRDCFRASVTLDLSRNVECYGPPKGSAVCVMLVHGGGGSRAMYRVLAKRLAEHGYRCVLPDLPGHGGRMDELLTLDALMHALEEVLEAETAPFQGVAPIYLGGSFGGYAGMNLLSRHPDRFSGAVMACCAQNTGVGASFKARTAISTMIFLSKYVISSSTIAKGIVSVLKSHKHLDVDHVMNTGVLTGLYFHQGVQQTKLLQEPNFLELAKKYSGPVLYLNGSDDHRDLLEKFLAINPSKLTRSILYPHGDHFFSHDKRFQEDFENDVLVFCNEVVAANQQKAV